MKKPISLAERWLWLGVAAIAGAGLYSLVPVIGRTPQLKNLAVTQHFFDVALVVHVDLSVLIWFLAMLGMGVSLVMEKHDARWPYWGRAGWWVVAAATAFMAASPLGAWVPVKSNYIPVLHNPLFLLSLGLLMAGLLVTLIPPVVTYMKSAQLRALPTQDVGWLAAAFVALVGLGCYALGGYFLPAGLEMTEHYERMFWAGGHVMQFCYTLVCMAAWLVLLQAMGRALPSRRGVFISYALAVAGALASASIFSRYPFDSGEFTYAQTRTMIELGGLGPTLLAALIIHRLLSYSPLAGESNRAGDSVGGAGGEGVPPTKTASAVLTPPQGGSRAYTSSLIVSLFLFFAGGALGLMIAGQNVTIPAHYHGMIVGITQGLMGLAYVVLPRFGYASVAGTRLAFWQPLVYGLGQTMHIGGLAYCGGYGILRKTAGGFENLAPDIKVALGIFGLGGLLAITGGLLFVVVMLKAARREKAAISV